MKKLIVLLLTGLMATSAFAVIDPDNDMLGVYFDLNADSNCLDIGPSIPFFVYVMITNPTAPQVRGLEFGYSITNTGGPGTVFRLASILPPGAFDFGNSTDPMVGD